MGGSEKQHIHASVFHLAAFADAKNQLARVSVAGEIRLTTPRNAGIVKNAITDYDAAPEDRFWFEQEMADAESKIAPRIKRAIADVRLGGPSRGDESAFTAYLALQYARSEHQGKWINRIKASEPVATDGVVAARAGLIGHQHAELANKFPYSCFYSGVMLAHPELPFVPFGAGHVEGVMLAVTPDVLFIRATETFDAEDPTKLYWERLQNMATPWRALFCSTQDAPMVGGFCRALASAKARANQRRGG